MLQSPLLRLTFESMHEMHERNAGDTGDSDENRNAALNQILLHPVIVVQRSS